MNSFNVLWTLMVVVWMTLDEVSAFGFHFPAKDLRCRPSSGTEQQPNQLFKVVSTLMMDNHSGGNDVSMSKFLDVPPTTVVVSAFLATTALLGLPALPPPAYAEEAMVVMHKLDYPVPGKCGQAAVPEKVAGLVKTMGKFRDQSCAADGFAVPQGKANGINDKDKDRVYEIYGKE